MITRRHFLGLLAGALAAGAGSGLAAAGALPNHEPVRGGVKPTVAKIPPQRIPRNQQQRRARELTRTDVVEFRCPSSSRAVRRRC